MERQIGLFILVFLIPIKLLSQEIILDQEVRMLALGDSYTIGASVGIDERWPHQLAAGLRELGFEVETPDYIALTGWTTQDLLRGIESQLDEQKEYNLVSILIGVNNQYRGWSIDLYEPDLRKIIEQALKIVSNDTGRIFMVSIPDYAYTPFGNGNAVITEGIDAYNAINYRVAIEYGLTYVNITTISRWGLDKPELVASDGLHPSGIQYGLWVEAIMSWMNIPHYTGDITSLTKESEPKELLKIIPNPSHEKIHVILSDEAFSLKIIDQTGRLLLECQSSDQIVHLDLSSYRPGIYWVEGQFASNRRCLVPVILN